MGPEARGIGVWATAPCNVSIAEAICDMIGNLEAVRSDWKPRSLKDQFRTLDNQSALTIVSVRLLRFTPRTYDVDLRGELVSGTKPCL